MLSAAVEPMHYALGATIAVKREALERSAVSARSRISSPTTSTSAISPAEYDLGIGLSSSIVTTVTQEQNFADFWNHQLRWARLIAARAR